MAVTYGFYNALNHDRLYDAIQMSSIFDGIIRDGIFSTIGDTMIVTAPEDGMYVNVGSGRAWFNHTWTLNDTAYPIEAEQAEVVLDRIDAVILEVNSSAEVRANSIKFLKGTPSSNPVKPTLTHNAEVNQYALAYVRIRAGQTTIFQSDIENAVGTDETPFITGVLQQVSIETLLKQWEAEFNTYFTNFQNTSTTEFNNWLATKVSEYTAWFAQMQTDMDSNFNEFDAWFQRMKDQLSQDAAGHLQAQIDALSEAAKKGSVVTVTTTDPTLFGKNVTISKTGFDPVTSSFNSAGVAYFETVPMVGEVSIEATNGTLTAHGSLNIPYFGRYNTTLEFWEAILDISTTIETLYNRQITVTKNSSTVGTTTFDSTGHATFSVHSVGTYHVSATDSLSTTYEVDVDVTEETTYIVEFIDAIDGATVEPTDDITTWLKCANIEDPSITTLADVLANRSLFETLIANSNACNYMARSTTWALAEGLVPTMTSDTTPSGECFRNGVSNNHYAYHAFDNDINTRWQGTDRVVPAWIGYTFTEPKIINRVKIIYIRSKTIKIQASNDGFVNDINDLTDVITTDAIEDNTFTLDISFNNSKAYLSYRLYTITTTRFEPAVTTLQFYSDADITTSQDAMSLIGKYDYCSNALLSNATWAEAIGNSEYFEEVLNVSVPKMTSNTAPSGEVSAISENGTTNPAYYAFRNLYDDTSNSECWQANDNKGTSHSNLWLMYKFPKAVTVKKFRISYVYTSTVNYKIQGSNNGSTFTDLGTFTNVRGTELLQNTKSYLYYRLLITSQTCSTKNVKGGCVRDLQFYGRASAQTNIIHSAANDTIYMNKNGSPVVLTTTDSNGVGTLDFTQFDDGVTYTLYSSVAKDPNNLSNDYSKNIRITKNRHGCTTEAYLMPDPVKTLYWYGYMDGSRIEACTVNNGWDSGSVGATFNTNDIRLYTSSTSQIAGIGTKKSINISDYIKLTVINNGITINGGTYGACGCNSTKVTNTENIGNYTASGLNKKEFDISTQTGNKYLTIANNANTRDLKILSIILE